MSVYERYKDGIFVCKSYDKILILVITAKSMGWVNRHGNQLKAPPLPPIEWAFEEVEDALPENAIQVDDPLPALDPRPKLPPIQWDFEDSLPPREHPMPVDEEAPPLPSLHWDFEELDDSLPNPVPVAEGAPPLPVAEEAPPLLPLKWNASSLPALKWEFKEPSSLPPLEWAFQEPPPEAPMPEDEDSMPVDVEALPPLDGNLRDLLHRAYLAMERATDKLSEFDEKGDPARDMARNQIQAGMQMQALYRQVEMYGRLREGMGSTLHVLRSVGPPALGQ